MRREVHTSDDTVEVRRGTVQGIDAPQQFVWQSRLWLVHEVQGHWTEAGGWGGQQAEPGSVPRQREVWRVDAASGRDGFHAGAGSGRRGVFDLVLDRAGAEVAWRLQTPAEQGR